MHAATLPVAVIGAGPVGLAAMAHLLGAGEEAVLFESGHQAGAAVSEWAHVRLFTRWEHNLDAAAAALLRSHGWVPPDPHEYPTGGELVDRYLVPLADLPVLAGHIHLATRVVSVTRGGLDKLKSTGRREAPFVLRVVDAGGERDVTAKAVIDASGTWYTPNPLGAGGVRAIGESGASARIRYGLPDVLGADRDRYAGGRVLWSVPVSRRSTASSTSRNSPRMSPGRRSTGRCVVRRSRRFWAAQARMPFPSGRGWPPESRRWWPPGRCAPTRASESIVSAQPAAG